MAVQVVCVRHMWVAVPHRYMLVPVAVCTRRHHFVGVVVVHVVVGMGVFVFQRHVFVFMRVCFGQVQHNAPHHQSTTSQHEGAG